MWSFLYLNLALVACASTAHVAQAPAAAAAGSAIDGDTDVTGRCEMVMNDRQGQPAPCDGIALFLRNPQSGEQRRATLDGYQFRFSGLKSRSYVLSAASAGYDVETNVRDEVTPGQVVRLRVRATRR